MLWTASPSQRCPLMSAGATPQGHGPRRHPVCVRLSQQTAVLPVHLLFPPAPHPRMHQSGCHSCILPQRAKEEKRNVSGRWESQEEGQRKSQAPQIAIRAGTHGEAGSRCPPFPETPAPGHCSSTSPLTHHKSSLRHWSPSLSTVDALQGKMLFIV